MPAAAVAPNITKRIPGMAIELKLTADEWKKIVFPHPTVGEIFKEAL